MEAYLGENIPKLGFGLMRLPKVNDEKDAPVDVEQVKALVDEFIARGFTYFDTAWMYCNFKSECAVKEFLVDRYPRDSFTLTTKLHSHYMETKDDRDRIFNRQKSFCLINRQCLNLIKLVV